MKIRIAESKCSVIPFSSSPWLRLFLRGQLLAVTISRFWNKSVDRCGVDDKGRIILNFLFRPLFHCALSFLLLSSFCGFISAMETSDHLIVESHSWISFGRLHITQHIIQLPEQSKPKIAYHPNEPHNPNDPNERSKSHRHADPAPADQIHYAIHWKLSTSRPAEKIAKRPKENF